MATPKKNNKSKTTQQNAKKPASRAKKSTKSVTKKAAADSSLQQDLTEKRKLKAAARNQLILREKSMLRRAKRERILRHRKRLRRSLRHELANQVSHGIGVGMGIAGLAFLAVKGALLGDALRLTAYSIYGTATILLYLASTLYHSIPHPGLKKLFRRMDHASIFLAIAGAYTPVTLIALGGTTGYILFSIVWAMAIAGVLYKSIFKTGYEFISVSLYILMGWLIIFAIKPLINSLPAPGLWLLLSGGISYTAGVIFFVMERMPYHHMIWHLFVLGGGVTHFIAIYMYM